MTGDATLVAVKQLTPRQDNVISRHKESSVVGSGLTNSWIIAVVADEQNIAAKVTLMYHRRAYINSTTK